MLEKAKTVIKNKRLEMKLSQKALAKKAGVSFNTIYNVEKGVSNSNLLTYQKICEALNIKFSDLL
ncbi:helix-turn-helix transcriptional regulator [Ruminococcus sp. XPD3002]|uniref:helix-turn-helix transcriptional regulator n=1 Tax=Ruminococcus sp. XPD3002 TaxID=1452269 RepID=UPI0009106C39|nr:DNA-binding transcriptional regulator, XRE-family HTH domain [Ruminococcus flavefaciens]